MSTGEHGTAGHEGPALSGCSWSSSLIAAMRRFKCDRSEAAAASDKIDRSASSLTGSDSATRASLAIR